MISLGLQRRSAYSCRWDLCLPIPVVIVSFLSIVFLLRVGFRFLAFLRAYPMERRVEFGRMLFRYIADLD